MYKGIPTGIKQFSLNEDLHKLHKEADLRSDFGMDNSSELVDNGFGIYSSVNTKKNIGPIKSQYYRIALFRSGSAAVTIGLETFHTKRNTLVFGFPGQIFSFQDPNDDFLTYYMLFTESFMEETFLLKKYIHQFPFLTYAGISCFEINEDEGNEIEEIVMKMNDEIKTRKTNAGQVIRLYIQMILILAGRSYNRQLLTSQEAGMSETSLYTRFLKLVSEHFMTHQRVTDYAEMLHVSADHLNRTIKSNSQKTAHEWIDEMILKEAKAHLLHSAMSVAEIAYHLDFSDPSHFNKFFRKLAGCTPLQYRRSE